MHLPPRPANRVRIRGEWRVAGTVNAAHRDLYGLHALQLMPIFLEVFSNSQATRPSDLRFGNFFDMARPSAPGIEALMSDGLKNQNLSHKTSS
jgi:hypothetical protein